MFKFYENVPIVWIMFSALIYIIFASYINVVLFYVIYVLKFVYSIAYYILSLLWLTISWKIALYVALVWFPLYYLIFTLLKKL